MFWYLLCFEFFFFKQKTAYDMRIRDWSSDVCSSYLFSSFFFIAFAVSLVHSSLPHSHPDLEGSRVAETNSHNKESHRHDHDHQHAGHEHGRSEERRVGNERVSTCRYRWQA